MIMMKKTIFLVILLYLVFLNTFSSRAYCQDWVYVGTNEDYTQYYKSSSVIIDKQNKTIKVWEKKVYTAKGRIGWLNSQDSIEKHNYNDIQYILGLLTFDYNKLKYTVTQITGYSKSGVGLFSEKYPIEWINIMSVSIGAILLNKVLKDYNIQQYCSVNCPVK
jgi:hypothetical protein